ncbi:MAG: response regulator [Nitrosopumilales archaeon]|nr:response regulator [Nitrosopumilales archaeon]
MLKPKLRIIIVDENRDVTSILAGTFGLKGYEVYKAYSVEECLNKVNELDGKVDIVFVDGKIAADRSAMLIIKVKRINSNIKIMVLAEDETDKTRVLEYGADEFAAKPISAETIVDKVYSLLLPREI